MLDCTPSALLKAAIIDTLRWFMDENSSKKWTLMPRAWFAGKKQRQHRKLCDGTFCENIVQPVTAGLFGFLKRNAHQASFHRSFVN
ncbi:MAG: hypothetical protein A3I66_13360 [Burkholderiales bacterium RIFCSPLOWO2_02_FULL_57_36]|nr:MAG: hypothetical protein A3I66_13360 [Burkholderiales bacterium RIFCSPLOWO2_02_FULL_57_36]